MEPKAPKVAVTLLKLPHKEIKATSDGRVGPSIIVPEQRRVTNPTRQTCEHLSRHIFSLHEKSRRKKAKLQLAAGSMCA